MRSASSEQNSIRSSACSTAARAPATSPSRVASSACSAPSTPRYCGSRESTASSAARASRSRAVVALVAAERQLGVAQARVELGVAAREAPPRDAGERARRPSPSRRRRTRTGRSRARARAGRVGSDAEPRVGGARHVERLAGAADAVQRLAEVRRGGGDVLEVAARRRPCSSARRSAATPSSISPVAASDTPSALSAPASSRWRRALLGELRLLGQRAAGDAHRAVVARLQHQHPRLPREQPGALGARPVVGEQREPALERGDRLVGAQQRPQRRAAAAP